MGSLGWGTDNKYSCLIIFKYFPSWNFEKKNKDTYDVLLFINCISYLGLNYLLNSTYNMSF